MTGTASRLLLLLGPSGSGKTTIIRHLCQLDNRFTYVKPFVTRLLRIGEEDKVHVSDAELESLNETKQLLAINELYGVRYGTPRGGIEEALTSSMFPVIDWPVSFMGIMERTYPGRLCTVYVRPPSIEILRERLEGRDNVDRRLTEACTELELLDKGVFNNVINLMVMTQSSTCTATAATILSYYLEIIKAEQMS